MEPRGRFAIVELTGGLGNQLFQFAAARALCLREGRTLYSAWHLHRGDTRRRPMLGAFRLSLSPNVLLLDDRTLRGLGLRPPLWRRKLSRLWPLPPPRVEPLVERDFPYAPLVGRDDGVVLRGYFQSWRYFADADVEIRDELTVREAPTGRNAELLARIGAENAICVHVRRGDYASNQTTRDYHGLAGLEYYRAAVEALGDARHSATFYVFSDEPAWARAHLSLPGATTFVDHNDADRPWEDLRLMAACRHFVLANSTFGWWGAYLARAPDQKVIAPLRWFAGATSDTRDLCPPTWVRL